MKISKELYEKVSKKTMTDYEEKPLDEENVFVDEYSIECMFEDLLCEMDSLEESKDDEIQRLEWKIQEQNDYMLSRW